MWLLLCSLGGRGHRFRRAKYLPRLGRRLAISGEFAWLSSPSRRLPVLRRLRHVRRSADCRDIHVRRVRRVRRICRRLVHLFGGGDHGCRDYCHRRHRCNDTSDSCRVVCARKVVRKPLVASRRRVGVRLVLTAPLAVVRLLRRVDARCARRSSSSRRFLRSPIATRSPVVDCRVRRVQLGGHGGHDRDRRDHHHIVIVVSTAMRSSLRLSSCSRVFLSALAQRSLLARLLSRARWSRSLRRAIDVVIVVVPHDRRYRRRRSSRSTLSSSSLVAIDVIVVVAPCDRRSSSSLLLAIDVRRRRSSLSTLAIVALAIVASPASKN